MSGHACASCIENCNAETRDRTGDLQIFSLTLSQLSYRGYAYWHYDGVAQATWVMGVAPVSENNRPRGAGSQPDVQEGRRGASPHEPPADRVVFYMLLSTFWAHGVVVSHPLRMRKALGSNSSVSILP